MSYLDVPRLHFAGSFTANPSTINNTSTNYGYNPVSNPISSPRRGTPTATTPGP